MGVFLFHLIIYCLTYPNLYFVIILGPQKSCSTFVTYPCFICVLFADSWLKA